MELTDLLSLEKWKEFEEEITRRSGLDANVFGIDGVRITDYKNWANRLCPAIKATDKGQSYICAVAHMNLATQAKQSHASLIEECDAGLVKIIVPVFVKDEFLGAVGACGMLLDEGEVDPFLINMTTGINEAEIEKLASDIGRIPREKAQSVLAYVETELFEIISEYNKK
ncbi:MAG: PocR ligand-binding domain-containing protein [Desulfobacterales bacterium]|jgi:ligand-binding sensor protein|nr:PocR ligand-binding domain-containing protein [Desulfobacterales bacterium]